MRQERVKDIFGVACEMTPHERGAYLDKACAGDDTLRPDVERLLAGHDMSEGLVDSGPFEVESPVYTLKQNDILNGRFRIIELIGSGGMGEVYAAEDRELGERVALKTLRAEFLNDPNFLRRFRREVRLARRVGHPNVCRVHDVGHHRRDDGSEVAFLTMELLEGQTLAEYLRLKARLTTEQALPLVKGICEALAALHNAGIIHRDLKPGNVMLVGDETEGWRPVVTDFGLALPAVQNAGSHSEVSAVGQVLGTPDYMAPEQLSGDEVGPFTDVYAMGLVVYEMVTGSKPFPAKTPIQEAVKKVSQSPRPPREFVADIDPTWEAILHRCLLKSPEQRFPSAEKLKEAFEPPRGLRLLTAWWHETFKPFGINRRWILAASVLSILVAAAVTTFGFLWMRDSPEAPVVLVAKVENRSNRPDRTEELTTFLRRRLEASDQVNLPAQEQLEETLAFMRRSPDSKLDRETALEVTHRLGIHWLISARVEQEVIRFHLEDATQPGKPVSTIRRRIDGPLVLEGAIEAAVPDLLAAIRDNTGLVASRPEPPPRVTTKSREALMSYSRALEFHSKGKLSDAIFWLKDAAARDPEFGMAYTQLANYLSGVGRYDEAFTNARAAYELREVVSKGERYLISGNYHLLTRNLTEARRSFVDLTRVLEAGGEIGVASGTADTVLAANSYRQLAHVNSYLGMVPEAIEAARRARTLNPSDVVNHGLLSILYCEAGQWEAALEAFEGAREQHPDSPYPFWGSGSGVAWQGRSKESP